MRDSIVLKRTYACSIDQLWEALTNAEAMSEWLMPCDIKPELGHTFQFKTKPQGSFDGIVNCEILAIIPKKLLEFSWCSGKMKTKVSFQLIDKGDTVDLNFTHSGFEGVFERFFVRQILSNGWKKKLLTVNLTAYLKK